MFLSHITAAAVLRGMKCLYATLELPEAIILARLKANLTGVPINSILEGSIEEAKTRMQELESGLGACIVKEFTPHATTIDDITEWVKNVEEEEGARIDLLVVDYGDKLSTSDKRDDSYNAARVTFEGMRVFAVDHNIWVWTASQATRKGKESKKRVDLEHVADSMHKVRVADLVVTLNAQDDGEQIEFYIGKNRLGKSRMVIGPIPHQFELGRIAGVNRLGEDFDDDAPF
jgi:replicative DNA helicase